MAISGKLASFLQTEKVKYVAVKHPVAYTAQEIAAAQHVPGKQLAKSVLILTEHGATLAVLPAIVRIDLKKLKGVLRAKKLTIGREADIKLRFPDLEVGAMSPFGNLYAVPVVVDKQLTEVGDIVFNGGTHTDTVKMKYADFARLVKPKVGVFGEPFPGQKQKKKAAPKKKKAAPKKTKKPTKKKKR